MAGGKWANYLEIVLKARQTHSSRHTSPLAQLCLLLGIFLSPASFATSVQAQPGKLTPPSDGAEKFMPGFVSTSGHEFGLAVTRDWSEIYFSRIENDFSAILEIHRSENSWSTPAVTNFTRGDGGGHPWLSSDESQIYFISRRPCPGAAQALNVWVSDRGKAGWSSAWSLGSPVTQQTVHAPSISATGSIYATGIIRLRKTEARYNPPEKLRPDLTGSHPAIAPDESFLVFSARREGGHGGKDLFVVFARDDESWSDPINLGAEVNSELNESSATLSSDGSALFFSRSGDIWWISSTVISRLQN
jgi:WD40-like Beta Propeller Repeat